MNEQLAQKNKTTMMALCGLFAAVTAICSWISIPLGFTPVPVNLGTLAIFLTGALLGHKYGPISIAVYVLAGAVGIPVFSGFRGGISVLAGPTGGYIIGYILAAFLIGLIIDLMTGSESKARKGTGLAIAIYAFAMICGLIACYALGTAWFMISTHTPFAAAMVSCVIPFLPGDALKIIASILLVRKLKQYI